MSTEHSRLSEEEILHGFSVEPTHDGVMLEHYLNQYPEHALALIDCSIELMIDTSRGTDEMEVSSEHIVEQAWRQFHASQNAAVENPFAQLNPTAFKAAAKGLNISNLLLIRFRDRAIDVTTIPRRLVQRLAVELGATVEAVSAYLQSPPTMMAGQSFRSSVKPSVADQISFEKAVETSQLTIEQKNALMALKD